MKILTKEEEQAHYKFVQPFLQAIIFFNGFTPLLSWATADADIGTVQL